MTVSRTNACDEKTNSVWMVKI